MFKQRCFVYILFIIFDYRFQDRKDPLYVEITVRFPVNHVLDNSQFPDSLIFMEITVFSINDYKEAVSFWKKTVNKMGTGSIDEIESIKAFFNRNPNMSFIARDSGKIIGTILCGHDGRRAFIHHIAISKDYEEKNLVKKLVDKCMRKLEKEGIKKCHVFIFEENPANKEYCKSLHWVERNDIKMFSHDLDYPQI